MKNHFIVPSGIKATPFGVTHRCATTSRIEYKEDVKIEAIPATPTADRIGAFAGRVSRPRSRNGRTRSAMIGNRLQRGAFAQRELGEDVRDLEEAPREQEVPVRDDQFRQLRTPSGSEERRHEGGQEEHDRGKQEDRDQVPRRLLREQRDAGLVVRPLRPILSRESRPALEDLLLDSLDLHGPPQWGSATPCNHTRPMCRTMSPITTRGRMKTCNQ